MGMLRFYLNEAEDLYIYYVVCKYCKKYIYGKNKDDIAEKIIEHLNEFHKEEE